MMRPSSVARNARPASGFCRLCFVPSRSFLNTAKPSRTTFSAAAPPLARRLADLQPVQHGISSRRYQSTEATGGEVEGVVSHSQPSGEAATEQLPSLSKLSDLVLKSKERFLSTDGIPTDQLTLAALKTCQGAANAIHPYLSKASGLANNSTASSASHLLSLGAEGRASATQRAADTPVLVRRTVDAISESAFAIIAHAPVVITPEALALYVNIQARIGRAETLPHVLEMFANKPVPRVVNGAIEYVPQNPKRADKAIEAQTAEAAVKAAIKARNLDAALGIIDCAYTSQAFVRQKLLRKALFPATILTGTPFAVYGLSSALSAFQNTVEAGTATKAAFAGIIAYLFFTSTIGTIAKVTSDDHMKRVSWAPGIALSQRWLREEERAALDQVACAWGYKQTSRHGEEGGVEWEALREYLGLKGMILDRVEFMEGMS